MKMKDERWNTILAAFERDPGNINAAAHEVGCQWRSAQAAWLGTLDGRRAIKDIIAEKQVMRRGLVADALESQAAEAEHLKAELREEARKACEQIGAERARFDVSRRELEETAARLEAASRRQQTAIAQRGSTDAQAAGVQELAWVRAVRAYNTAVLSALHGALSPAAVQNLHALLARAATDGSMTPADGVRLVRSLVSFAKPLTEALKIGLEAERLAAGAPTSITRTEVTLDPEDRAALEALAQRNAVLLEQVRGLGALDAPAEEAVLELPAKGEACQDGCGQGQDDVRKVSQVPAETEDESADTGEGGESVAHVVIQNGGVGGGGAEG